jgi:hypothetical protein
MNLATSKRLFHFFDLQCIYEFQILRAKLTPSCTLVLNPFGPSFSKNNKFIDEGECRKGSDMANDPAGFSRLISKEREKYVLANDQPLRVLILMNESSNSFDGEFYSSDKGGEASSLPTLKKGFNSVAKGRTADGVRYTLESQQRLTVASGYSVAEFSGSCRNYDSSSLALSDFLQASSAASPPESSSTSSKIDKAKATCTDLGFTAGTEKHGECVLKVMDN